MLNAWVVTYCWVFGLFKFIQKHIILIYSVIIAFLLGMIFWWYLQTLLS